MGSNGRTAYGPRPLPCESSWGCFRAPGWTGGFARIPRSEPLFDVRCLALSGATFHRLVARDVHAADIRGIDQSTIQTIIMVMSRTLPLSEVKAKLSEVVDEVVTTQERVTVTRNGRPVAVVLSTDDLEAIEETLAILSDPAAMAEIQQGRAAIASGDVATKDEIEALRNQLRSKTA